MVPSIGKINLIDNSLYAEILGRSFPETLKKVIRVSFSWFQLITKNAIDWIFHAVDDLTDRWGFKVLTFSNLFSEVVYPFVNRPYVEGQPIGIPNQGNTCFINAAFQMIMNNPELKSLFISSFKNQLESYTLYEQYLNWLAYEDQEDRPNFPIQVTDLSLILPVLSQDFNKLNLDESPNLSVILNEYTEASKKDTVFPELENTRHPDIYKELQSCLFKSDQAFQKALSTCKNTIGMFQSFLTCVDLYEKAEQNQMAAIVTEDNCFSKLRLFLNQRPGFFFSPQEDAHEWIEKLFSWLRVSDSEHLKFSIVNQRSWDRYEPINDLDRNLKELQYLQYQTRQEESNQKIPEAYQLSEMPFSRLTNQLETSKGILAVPVVANHSIQNILDQMTTFQAVPHTYSICFKEGWYTAKEERQYFIHCPNQLIISVKRFDEENQKKCDSVFFSETLKLPEEAAYGRQMMHHYRLQTIVYHFGSTAGGHYISYVKKNDKWWRANDSSIALIGEGELKDALNHGYLYCYQKINPESESFNSEDFASFTEQPTTEPYFETPFEIK